MIAQGEANEIIEGIASTPYTNPYLHNSIEAANDILIWVISGQWIANSGDQSTGPGLGCDPAFKCAAFSRHTCADTRVCTCSHAHTRTHTFTHLHTVRPSVRPSVRMPYLPKLHEVATQILFFCIS